jgi:hypothetical protein
MGDRRGAYRVLVKKPEGWALGRPRHRRGDIIKRDLREVRWEHELNQSGSGQGQAADLCECGNEPSGSIKCWEFLE